MPEKAPDRLLPAGNISHKLRVRQQIAALLQDLVHTDDPLVRDRRQTSLLGAGHDLLVMVGRCLDTADPQAISRLGTLAAAYPDRPGVVAYLRQEALSPQNSDLKRMATMVVLEQFLDEELGDHFFATLR
ncbi:MAG TPA: hypothetical protein VKY74_15640, partial [Chloroflexia bacterium]|nr:hypothetical protein [Chloroflexia bacterium]